MDIGYEIMVDGAPKDPSRHGIDADPQRARGARAAPPIGFAPALWQIFAEQAPETRDLWRRCVWQGECLCILAEELDRSPAFLRAVLLELARQIDALRAAARSGGARAGHDHAAAEGALVGQLEDLLDQPCRRCARPRQGRTRAPLASMRGG